MRDSYRTHGKALAYNTIGSIIATILVTSGATVVSAIAARSAYFTGQPVHKSILIGVLVFVGLGMGLVLIGFGVQLFRREKTGKASSDELSEDQRLLSQSRLDLSNLQQKYTEVTAAIAGKKQQLKEETRKYTDMKSQKEAVVDALAKTRSQVGELEQQLRVLQAWQDEFEWLIEIARDQANTIFRFVTPTTVHIGNHELKRSDPYIDFVLPIDNRSVYDVRPAESLEGRIFFHERELRQPLRWVERISIPRGDARSSTLRQNLTPEDVDYILKTDGSRFDLARLKITIAGDAKFADRVIPQLAHVHHLNIGKEGLS